MTIRNVNWERFHSRKKAQQSNTLFPFDSGHNGIRSIIASLGTDDFRRIRIGIGKQGDTATFVLEKFGTKELKELDQVSFPLVNKILAQLFHDRFTQQLTQQKQQQTTPKL